MTGHDPSAVQISVIMSTYNEPLCFLQSAIESILKQTFRDYEFLIVLDNPGNTAIRDCVFSYADRYPQIRVLPNEKNVGLVGSLNRALRESRGGYIARMDADDISMPDRLAVQLAFLKKHALDLVGSNVTDINENGDEIRSATVYPTQDRAIKRNLRYYQVMPHPTWLVRREVYAVLEGYREIDACEDYDFLARAALRGFKLGNVSEPLLYYRINKNSISNTKKGIQKMALAFFSRAYRRKKSPEMSAWKEYKESKRGKTAVRNIEEVYRIKNEYLEDKRILRYFIKEIMMVIGTRDARDLLAASLASRRFVLIENRKTN